MTEQLVKLSRRGKVATITLNRPARHNVLVPELLSALLESIEHDDCQSAAAVVLRAEGRSFSTGGDLLEFKNHSDTIGDYSRKLVGQLNRVILAIYAHPAPIVCAVHGQVTGGSLGLLLATDWVIMRRGVTITPYYAVVGFSPDGGWTALLPDIIGRQQTMHWLASNASYDADTCMALGLVHQVVEDDCDTVALTWAEKVAEMQSGSIAQARRLLNINIDVLRRRLQAELDTFVIQIQTQQALDGINHFLRRQDHV
jgi:2-(1,2-epoxy-1,2-dihydrophenyl)acetyl-CoA isomerase